VESEVSGEIQLEEVYSKKILTMLNRGMLSEK
jgi:hypothetical protein